MNLNQSKLLKKLSMFRHVKIRMKTENLMLLHRLITIALLTMMKIMAALENKIDIKKISKKVVKYPYMTSLLVVAMMMTMMKLDYVVQIADAVKLL